MDALIKYDEIPITNDGYINYIIGSSKRSQIFLIKPCHEGITGMYQYDGTLCKQGSVRGFVVCSFESKNKYFNPDFWYKKTAWGDDYPNKIYFDLEERDHYEEMEKMYASSNSDKLVEDYYKGLDEVANSQARPVENILKSIIRSTEKAFGAGLHFVHEDKSYGEHWFEAHVPLQDKMGNRYILTWANCD